MSHVGIVVVDRDRVLVQVVTSQPISVTTANADQIQHPDPLVEPLAHCIAVLDAATRPCTADNVTAGSHTTPASGFAWLHGLHDGVPTAVGTAPRGDSDRRQVTRRKPIASRGRGTSDRASYPVHGVPSTRGWSRKRRSHSSLNQGVKVSGAHAISARRACGMT
jgi:hypothetical protein